MEGNGRKQKVEQRNSTLSDFFDVPNKPRAYNEYNRIITYFQSTHIGYIVTKIYRRLLSEEQIPRVTFRPNAVI
jgi:hypothetical protein